MGHSGCRLVEGAHLNKKRRWPDRWYVCRASQCAACVPGTVDISGYGGGFRGSRGVEGSNGGQNARWLLEGRIIAPFVVQSAAQLGRRLRLSALVLPLSLSLTLFLSPSHPFYVVHVLLRCSLFPVSPCQPLFATVSLRHVISSRSSLIPTQFSRP